MKATHLSKTGLPTHMGQHDGCHNPQCCSFCGASHGRNVRVGKVNQWMAGDSPNRGWVKPGSRAEARRRAILDLNIHN
jgi:hypothetical protein